MRTFFFGGGGGGGAGACQLKILVPPYENPRPPSTPPILKKSYSYATATTCIHGATFASFLSPFRFILSRNHINNNQHIMKILLDGNVNNSGCDLKLFVIELSHSQTCIISESFSVNVSRMLVAKYALMGCVTIGDLRHA